MTGVRALPDSVTICLFSNISTIVTYQTLDLCNPTIHRYVRKDDDGDDVAQVTDMMDIVLVIMSSQDVKALICVRACMSQALSHFSFWYTNGREMWVDVQGVGTRYTDPQLHSKSLQYGRADRGEKGFRQFFKTHVCRKTCKLLLPPSSLV